MSKPKTQRQLPDKERKKELTFEDWSIYWSTHALERIMNIEVGSYEAKTKLPELLRGVQGGKRYTITLRGEAVADLVPAQGSKLSDVVAAVDEMWAFMRSRKPVVDVDLKALINEGRV
jgi:antitoxin (DNA-binding transcriptional repressor) of toxin-antitoxin stability system